VLASTYQQQLPEEHATVTRQLGTDFDYALQVIAKVLLRYGKRTMEGVENQVSRDVAIMRPYLSDLLKIKAFNLYRNRFVTIGAYMSASDVETLFRRYANDPDVSKKIIKQTLDNNPATAAEEIERYKTEHARARAESRTPDAPLMGWPKNRKS